MNISNYLHDSKNREAFPPAKNQARLQLQFMISYWYLHSLILLSHVMILYDFGQSSTSISQFIMQKTDKVKSPHHLHRAPPSQHSTILFHPPSHHLPVPNLPGPLQLPSSLEPVHRVSSQPS